MPSPSPPTNDQAEVKLRSRMHALREASSPSKVSHDRGTATASPPSSFTPESEDAETTEDDGAELSAYEEHGKHAPHYHASQRPSVACAPENLMESKPSWYQFDAAVLIAMVSCLGNFLTGGDHLRNILLSGLLVFYLHQIIEVPWRLYLQARPRMPHSRYLQEQSERPSTASAASALRQRELALLAFAVISPFLGVSLLTRVTTAATGDPHALSWFSRTLFILAAGIRPWRHLSDRLSSGIDALHNAVHYPPSQRGTDVEKEIAELRHSLSRIEHALLRLDGRSREVCEYVDDALDAVERRVRRQERRMEKREREVAAQARAETVFVEAPKRAPSLVEYLLPWWMVQGSGNAGAQVPAPRIVQGKRAAGRPAKLETIPEDGVLPSLPAQRPAPPATGNILSRLLTLPLRFMLRLLGLG